MNLLRQKTIVFSTALAVSVTVATASEYDHKMIQKLRAHHDQYHEKKSLYLQNRHRQKKGGRDQSRLNYTLSKAFHDALYYDGIFAQARASFEASKDSKLIAWSSYFPQITANGTAFSNTNLNMSAAFSVSAQQLIFNWSVIRGISKANAEVRKAVLTLSYAEQQLMERVAIAYFNVVKLQAHLQVNQSQQRAIIQQLQAVQERAHHGFATVTDVERVRGTLDLYQAQVTGIQIELHNAFNALTEITGRVVNKLPLFAGRFKLLKPEPLTLSVWQTKVKQKNFNLKIAEESVLVAKAEVGVQFGHYLPSLAATGSYFPEKVAGVNKKFTYGLNISFSAINGGSTVAQVGMANADYQKSLSERDMAFRDANTQLNSAYTGMLLGVSQIRAAKRSVSSNYNALQYTKEGYIAGTQTILDVLDQQSKLFDARRAYVNDRYQYLKNIVTLEITSGSLSPPVLHSMQRWFAGAPTR